MRYARIRSPEKGARTPKNTKFLTRKTMPTKKPAAPKKIAAIKKPAAKVSKPAKKVVAKNVIDKDNNPKLIEEVMNQLNTILDPELGVGIVDLGLIYDVKIENKVAVITMTLTTMGCPVGPMLIEQVDMILPTIFPEHIESAHVEIVWDPPWSPEKMKPEIRDLMQGF